MTAPLPETIDDVVHALDQIIDRARHDADRVGYFAALYRRVTLAVKDGIARGAFDDGPRMARLDICFAGRYLAAMDLFQRHQPMGHCWLRAFNATRKRKPILLQHLLLGMNAHINLDLGVAAAQIAPGDAFPSLKNDFNRINQVLAALVERVQAQIDGLSPAIALLDRVGARADGTIVNFSVDRARDAAWSFASSLAAATADAWPNAIARRDEEMSLLAKIIERPGPLTTLALLWIRLRESGDVARNIDVLAAA